MRTVVILLLGLLCRTPPTLAEEAPALVEHPEVAPRIRLFETWVGEQMAYRHQPAVVVGVVSGDDLVWARGFGYRDLENKLPATPETLFRVGSVSKLFTATAILQLRDRGVLRLEDPVVEHLPWFRFRNRFPDGPEITLRHLLTHTSGLPREAAFPYWTDRHFPSREQMIEALTRQENLFAAGSSYQYSNLGIALLGEVVAAASSSSYEDYVKQHILEPLGMASTSVRFGDVSSEHLATGYLLRRADGSHPAAPPTRAEALAPAADISSNLVDLARFLSAHLYQGPASEAPLLQPSTAADMHRVHWLSGSWKSGRGLGFSVWRHEDRTLVGHGGWVAGYRTQVAFDPKTRFGVIVLTSSDEGGPATYLNQAFDFLVPAMEKGVRPKERTTRLANAERYAGAYHNPWGEVTDIVAIDGRLLMSSRSYPPTSDLEGTLSELVPDSEHTFRRGPNGERLIFELLPDGRVARVKIGENYLFPADCGAIREDLHCTWSE